MDKLEFFPLSNQKGSSTELNSELMHNMSENSEPISKDQFSILLEEHKLFLESGGKGGSWQTFEAAGLTLAVYMGGMATRGKQASFLNSNLTLLDLSGVNFECADFVNIYYPNGNFRKANMKTSIFVDSFLQGCDFSGADLTGSDFSRAVLTNCKFLSANLAGCDFENCDLTDSDFTGAITSDARFPGANLNGVKY